MKKIKVFAFAVFGVAAAATSCGSNEFNGYEFYKLTPEVPATCTYGGMKAHYESKPKDGQEVKYLDVDKKAVNYEDLIIPALGHNMTLVEEVYSTCTGEGVAEHYHCSNCNLDFEDEAGVTIATDLTKSARGHVMEQAWTPSPTANKHHHKCARPNCDHIEDEEDCVFDQEVVNDNTKVDGKDNSYYYSCVCGRIDTNNSFEYVAPETFAADGEEWEEKYAQKVELDTTYDPAKDTQVTLKDIGIDAAEYRKIPDHLAGHIFGTYDMSEGIDLVYNLKFNPSSEKYVYMYFGNQEDEDGLQIRLMTTENSKYVRGYFYANKACNLVKSDGEPFYVGTDASSLFYVKAAQAGTERKVEVKLEPSDEVKVTGYDMFKISIFIDGIKFHKEAENPTSIDDLYVGYPEGYFNGDKKHNKVRFSCYGASETMASIKDAESEPCLIFFSDSGKCIGKCADDNCPKMEDLTRTGCKFVGWYDSTGRRINSETHVNGKTIVIPHFVEIGSPLSSCAVTLSDLGFLPAGSHEFITNRAIAGEYNEGFRQIPVSAKTTSISVSFIATLQLATPKKDGTVTDDYFQFGLPFDYVDENTRNVFRINAHSSATSLSGYMGHPSTNLGPHGTEGTKFEETDFAINENSTYLITLSVKEGETSGFLTLKFEIVNLGVNQLFSCEIPGVEFIKENLYSFTNQDRNYFSVFASREDASIRMSNAW